MDTLHQIGDIIRDRYQILEKLGQGSMGTTYEARDRSTHQTVAIKAVSFRHISDWKTLELFEREAHIMANLNHAAIPNYIDYFHVDTDSDRIFYLVRQLVQGESLADLLDRSWRGDEMTIRNIATQVLDILRYLHSLSPPVIHRDIKPQNIIRQADGQVFLVDFGAVQDVYRMTLSRSGTFVGTIGYMPPEQFRGHVMPASDLYALGSTIIFLLTGRSPDEIPQVRMKPDFRPLVNISEPLANWLDRMVEPAIEDRFQTAAAALDALNHNAQLAKRDRSPSRSIVRSEKPAGSRIQLDRSADTITVVIPPAGLTPEILSFAGFAVFWNAFILVWTIGAASGSLVFALFSIPFWMVGLGMLSGLAFAIAGQSNLTINRDTFCLKNSVLGMGRSVTGNTADINDVRIQIGNTKVNGRPLRSCALEVGVKTHTFAMTVKPIEREWLINEINDFLTDPLAR